MNFEICIDESNPFNQIFLPLASKFKKALQINGYNSGTNYCSKKSHGAKIVFGAHSNPLHWAELLKPNDILVNLEPVYLEDWRNKNPQYCQLLKQQFVLDYTLKNRKFLAHSDIFTIPPQFSTHKNCKKDIDILFVGNLTQYRKNIISKIIHTDTSFSLGFGIFGDDLVKAISRSKLFLNINSEGQNIFNSFRYSLCSNSNTLFVGDIGGLDDSPELAGIVDTSIFWDVKELRQNIRELLNDKTHYLDAIQKQHKIADLQEQKFFAAINKIATSRRA